MRKGRSILKMVQDAAHKKEKVWEPILEICDKALKEKRKGEGLTSIERSVFADILDALLDEMAFQKQKIGYVRKVYSVAPVVLLQALLYMKRESCIMIRDGRLQTDMEKLEEEGKVKRWIRHKDKLRKAWDEAMEIRKEARDVERWVSHHNEV